MSDLSFTLNLSQSLFIGIIGCSAINLYKFSEIMSEYRQRARAGDDTVKNSLRQITNIRYVLARLIIPSIKEGTYFALFYDFKAAFQSKQSVFLSNLFIGGISGISSGLIAINLTKLERFMKFAKDNSNIKRTILQSEIKRFHTFDQIMICEGLFASIFFGFYFQFRCEHTSIPNYFKNYLLAVFLNYVSKLITRIYSIKSLSLKSQKVI